MGDRIFLCYGRGDDEPFVRTLFTRLDEEGFDVWFDRECMPSRALTFLQEIRDEIRSRDRVVVVLGPHAVCSDYVRAEWQAGLVDGKVVTPVLRSGDYDIVPPELSNLHCPDVRSARPFTEAFDEVLRVLRDPIPPLGRLVGPIPSVPAHFQPRTDALSRLAASVLYEIEHPVVIEPPLRTTVLHGMGGVGKSILATSFARATTTRRVFTDGIVWIDVTPGSTPLEVMRSVLTAIGEPLGSLAGLGEAVTVLRSWLETRRCLIVLDNVWSVAQAAPVLQTISPVARLLITSRDEGLATSLGAGSQLLETLTPEAARAHLADWVGLDPDLLPDEAREVAVQCGGLPFALALQGALAQDGVPWVDLLDALREADLSFARQHFPDYPHPHVLATIQVSIDQLQATDASSAQRMLDLGAFIWDEGVRSELVTAFWAERANLSPREGRRLLVELERKALIRLDGDLPAVRIHDLIADYLRAKSSDRDLGDALLDFYRGQCPDDWPSGPDDGYFFRHLLDHLAARDDGIQEIERILSLTADNGGNAWFQAADRAGHLDAYRRQLERQIHDPQNSIEVVASMSASIASVNSLAGMLPPSIAGALVGNGDWTTAQALNYVRQVLDPASRAAGLVRLVGDGGGDEAGQRLLDEAVAAARSLEEIPLELIPLIDALAGAGRAAEALELARRTGPADPRTTALTTVVAHLDQADKGEVLGEAIEVASQTGAPFRAAALEPILPHLDGSELASVEARVVEPLEVPSARDGCRTLVVKRLLELGEADAAWERATQIEDPLDRAEAVVHCLPGPANVDRESAIDDVVSAVVLADRKEMEERYKRELVDLPASLRWFLPRFLASQPVRSSILAGVAPWLSARHVTALYRALVETDDTLFAAEGAAALRSVLGEEAREHLIDHMAGRVSAITEDEERVRARAALAELAPDARRLSAFEALLSDVERVAGPFKASSVARLAAVVSLPSERDRAIDVADRIEDPEQRTAALEALIGDATPIQVRRAAAVATSIRDDEAILVATAALAAGLDRATQTDILRRSDAYPDYPRARVVALLARALAEPDVPKVAQVAGEIEAPGALAEILLPALAARTGGAERHRVLERAVGIAAGMTDPERRIWALEAMIEHFDEEFTHSAVRAFERGEPGLDAEWRPFGRTLLHAVVGRASDGAARTEHVDAALALVPELAKAGLRRNVLNRIAASMDERQWATAVALVTAEEDPHERAITSGFLLGRAPAAIRPALVHEAMREFQSIEATEYSSLWERQQGAAARILAYTVDPLEHLHLVERMDSEDWKREALREYGRVIPASELHRLTALIDSLADPSDRASVEVIVADRLAGDARDELLARALEHALNGSADLWHDRHLPPLATALCTLPPARLAVLWRDRAPQLANMSRAQLAAHLHGLAPMIVHAGAAGVMARALLGAQRWWP